MEPVDRRESAMSIMTLELPDNVSVEEAKLLLAMALFSEGRLSQGQAARLAGYTRETFIELLGKHGVSFTNISLEELDEEIETWRALPSRTVRP